MTLNIRFISLNPLRTAWDIVVPLDYFFILSLVLFVEIISAIQLYWDRDGEPFHLHVPNVSKKKLCNHDVPIIIAFVGLNNDE